MFRVIWRAAALEEIFKIYEFLYARNPKAAQDVADTIRTTGDNLNILPRRGRPVGKTGMREVTMPYPYVIRYRIDGADVVIIRVRHTARRTTTP